MRFIRLMADTDKFEAAQSKIMKLADMLSAWGGA